MIQLAVLQQPAKFDRDTAIIWINRPPLLSVFGVASCLTLARLLFTFWSNTFRNKYDYHAASIFIDFSDRENAFVAAGQGFRQCIAGFLWKFKVSVLVVRYRRYWHHGFSSSLFGVHTR